LIFLSGQVTTLFSLQICHHNSGSYSSQINVVECIFLNTKNPIFYAIYRSVMVSQHLWWGV
jgi:hypothetical protein